MGALFFLFGGFVVGFGAGIFIAACEKAFKDFNQLPM